MAEAWAPALDDVARHIPTRTRDTRTPGSDAMLGTFTPSTTPTDSQAQAVIDDAVSSVLSVAGQLPAPGTQFYQQVSVAARVAAEWRAAADIEVAYPNRDADIRVFAQLDARAKDALAALLTVMAHTETGAVESVPVWQMPAPPAWSDVDPGSGTETIAGAMGWF
jgi:hypothetical protein